MKKTKGFLLAVAVAAMAFTFSCSSDGSDDGGNEKFSYCVFSGAQSCFEGPYTSNDCNSSGGIPSNSCPYGGGGSSPSVTPSSSGTTPSSSGGALSSSSSIDDGNTVITIVNNTTYAITDVRIKPSTFNGWGDDRETATLANGASKTYTLLPPYSATNEYDIILRENSTDAGGNNFRKYKVTVTNGMTITFNAADLDNGGNLPTIYMRNRTGIAATSLRVRPSGTTGWTKYDANISNNNDGISLGMQIPLSSYSVYDFELISANPANTFAKSNVTIANGTILTFTSAEAATPIVGYPTIVVQNNTGEMLVYFYAVPEESGATTWGTDLLPINLQNGGSYAFTLKELLSTYNVYGFRAQGMFASTYNGIKRNVTVTEGMVLIFDSSDKQ